MVTRIRTSQRWQRRWTRQIEFGAFHRRCHSSIGRLQMKSHPTAYSLRRYLDMPPAALIAYLLFAIVVTLIDYNYNPPLGSLPPSFRRSLLPYTGSFMMVPYAFTLIFALPMIFNRIREYRQLLRFFGITVLLFIFIVYGFNGVYRLGRDGGPPDLGIPHLAISPWRPIWTILIPSIWIAVLYLPSMNRFCRVTPNPNEEEA